MKKFSLLICLYVVTLTLNAQEKEEILESLGAKMKANDIPGAISDLTKYINLDTLNITGYLYRANLYEKIGKKEEALKDISKMISLTEDDNKLIAMLYYKKGFIYYELLYDERGAWYYDLSYSEACIFNLSKSIDYNPNDPSPYALRHDVYNAMGMKREAIDDVTKLIEFDPVDENRFNQRGYYYHSITEYEKASADFLKALSLNPSGVNHLNVKAWDLCIMSMNLSGALIYANHSVNRKRTPTSLLVRADIYTELEEYQKALIDINEAMKIAPDIAQIYYKRGLINIKLGNTQEGESDLKKAKELDPSESYSEPIMPKIIYN